MNNKVILLGLFTLVVFGYLGSQVIKYFQGRSLFELLVSGLDPGLQLFIGLIYGLASAKMAWSVIRMDFFKNEKNYYSRLVSKLKLNNAGIIFLSLSAGIGEEVFFRGALQPLLGLWVTSIIFVAIHGYLNPFNWRISIYGIIMVFIIAGIGFLFEKSGLVSAIAAHAAFDFVLFRKLA